MILSKVYLMAKGKSVGVSIPKKIREKLNIKAGDYLIWYEDNGRVCVAKAEIMFKRG